MTEKTVTELEDFIELNQEFIEINDRQIYSALRKDPDAKRVPERKVAAIEEDIFRSEKELEELVPVLM